MGQLIEVSAVAIGDIALFDTDRSLTGQDPWIFGEPTQGEEWPTVLANRLFETDPAINNIHMLSNTISVRRTGGWPDSDLDSAADVINRLFVFYEAAPDDVNALREQFYNATITSIRAHNEELWVMRVTPDEPAPHFDPGQYTTLALGYWEPRADEATEPLDPAQTVKLARRSYSVSSSIVDRNTSELVAAHPEDVEFYIVKVRPGEEEIPALTPRIFLKGIGDRMFMGTKFAGRYTLAGVESDDKIVFLSTGTGEAPQNAMTAELLRNGHSGPILNLVCVRYKDDLAYLPEQAIVAEKWPNYRYEYITTREEENRDNKRYLQDLLGDGTVEEMLGSPLDPEDTHVFLCGNPAMIGLPKWDGDQPTFPKPKGVSEMLHERGFTIDRHKVPGNVHYEEYWKER